MERRARILIVEDEGIVGMDLQDKLIKAGYEAPLVVASSEEALESITEAPPDLVLMDIHIQGLVDGIDTADLIRKQFDLPIIFVTAHADSGMLERARAIQPFGYIVKPISTLSLIGSIEMALHKHIAEKRIKEHRAWLTTVLSSIPDAVIVTDTAGKIEFMNPAARLFSGGPLPDATGRDISAVLRLEDREDLNFTKVALRKAMLMGEFSLPRDVYLRVEGGKSKRLVEGQVAASRTKEQIVGAVFTLRDVSGQREEDQQIRQEQKMIILGQFAADVAQVFKRLFDDLSHSQTTMKQLSKTFSGQGGESFSAEIEAAGRASTLGSVLASDLCELAQYGTLRPERVDVNTVATSVVPLMQTLGDGIDLKLELCAEPAVALIHPTHLRRVLLNVLAHARERLANPGSIQLSTEVLKNGEELIRIAVESGPLRSRDADHPELGEPEIPSLDLSLASAIVTAAEGDLRIYESGRVEILLPRQRALVENKAAFAERQGVVLLVGADAQTALALQQSLETERYVVLAAGNLAEARLVEHHYQGTIDAVVVDGDAVNRKKRDRIRSAVLARNLNALLLCLSGESGAGDPGWHYVLKPFDARTVTSLLQNLIRTGTAAMRAVHG
ncbi:MAG: response regulator [Acidobacteriota bacterium]